MQILRCGLSAIPRGINLSLIWEAQYPHAGVLGHFKQESIEQAGGVVRSSADPRAKTLELSLRGFPFAPIWGWIRDIRWL